MLKNHIGPLRCIFLLALLAIFCNVLWLLFKYFGHHLWVPLENKIQNSLWLWQLPLIWVIVHSMQIPDWRGILLLHSPLNSSLVMRQNQKGASTMCPLEHPSHMSCYPSGWKWGSAPPSKKWGEPPSLY